MSNYNVIIPHYSVFYADSLSKIIQDVYPFKNKIQMELLHAAMNDIYSVQSGEYKYYLKVPRFDRFWPFTKDTYNFEAHLLAYLHKNNFSVSYSIPTKERKYLGILNAPEGIRYYAMYTNAPGVEPKIENLEHMEHMGKYLGQFHKTTENYTSKYNAISWNFELLLDYGMEKLKEVIDERFVDDIRYFENKARKLIKEIKQLLPKKTKENWGVIHGDYAPKNIRIDETGKITSFDFEFTGYGYRIYDFVFMVHKTHIQSINNKYFQAFLEGYQNIRHLSQNEIDSIIKIAKLALISRLTVSTGFYYLVGKQWFDTKLQNDIKLLKNVF